MDVSVVVSRSCNISTERGAAGAELEASCPQYAKQSLVREFIVSPEPRPEGVPSVTEQLVLVVNF